MCLFLVRRLRCRRLWSPRPLLLVVLVGAVALRGGRCRALLLRVCSPRGLGPRRLLLRGRCAFLPVRPAVCRLLGRLAGRSLSPLPRPRRRRPLPLLLCRLPPLPRPPPSLPFLAVAPSLPRLLPLSPPSSPPSSPPGVAWRLVAPAVPTPLSVRPAPVRPSSVRRRSPLVAVPPAPPSLPVPLPLLPPLPLVALVPPSSSSPVARVPLALCPAPVGGPSVVLPPVLGPLPPLALASVCPLWSSPPLVSPSPRGRPGRGSPLAVACGPLRGGGPRPRRCSARCPARRRCRRAGRPLPACNPAKLLPTALALPP